jgi:hypothetical protein
MLIEWRSSVIGANLRGIVEPAHAAPDLVTSPGWRSQTSKNLDSPRPSTYCPQIYGIGVCQLDSVEVTLSFRETPHPGNPREHEIVSRLWGGDFRLAMSPNPKWAFGPFQGTTLPNSGQI